MDHCLTQHGTAYVLVHVQQADHHTGDDACANAHTNQMLTKAPGEGFHSLWASTA